MRLRGIIRQIKSPLGSHHSSVCLDRRSGAQAARGCYFRFSACDHCTAAFRRPEQWFRMWVPKNMNGQLFELKETKQWSVLKHK